MSRNETASKSTENASELEERFLGSQVNVTRKGIQNARKVVEMCEFSVFIRGEVVFKDAIYARADGNKVILKDVLGVSKVLKDCRIVEIDVGSERLVLSPTEVPS